MSRNPIRVILIEDHAIVREGYRRLLEQTDDIEVIGEADNGEEGAQLAVSSKADVIVVDLSLPGISGLETIRRITTRQPDSRALVFTMHDNVLLAERALQNGAKGYITKSSSMDEMIMAVREIAAGKIYLDSSIAKELAIKKVTGNDSPFTSLSPREFEIFKLVVSGKKGTEVADSLCLTPKTVSNYISQIKSKVGASTTAELVHLALKYGVLSNYNYDSSMDES